MEPGDIAQKIRETLETILRYPDKLYDLKINQGAGHLMIEVLIDNLENKFGSVSIETCEHVSRELSRELDATPGFPDFAITVSSVGAERALSLPDDLKRFCGLDVRLDWKDESGSERSGIFRLLDCEETVLLGKYGSGKDKKRIVEEVTLNINDITKGNLYLKI